MDSEALSADSITAEAISNRRRSNSVSDDYSVQRTNDDATQCKFYAIQKGYWSDEFIARFANTCVSTAEARRFPEISLGYWARTKAVENHVVDFIRKNDGNAQVISLGCGFDTLFWRIASAGEKLVKYVEVDFSSVTAKKIRHILKPGPQPDPVTFFTEKVSVVQHSDLHAGNYHLVGADLRQTNEFEAKLDACHLDKTIPTIVIAECVLVYMSSSASSNLLKSISSTFDKVAFVNYEQFQTSDQFTKVMEQNLGERGIHLRGLQVCQSAEKQTERFKEAGFVNVEVSDMNDVYEKKMNVMERIRVNCIESLDEMELLEQLLAHYCIVYATNF